MQDDYSDDDIRRMEEELLQSDARLKEIGGPSTLQADQIMQQVNDRAAGKHVFTKSTDDRSVFVTNLPKGDNGGYSTTHEDLHKFFEDCGQILTLTILTDRKTGQAKGSAYIEFATFEGHGKALDTKQNANFFGNIIKVEKKRSLYRPTGADARGRGRGGAPAAGPMGMGAGGADAMTAMLAMMMAAAGKAAQGMGMGGGMGMGMGGGMGRGGMGMRGGGRGGRGGRGAGGFGGPVGMNAANPFGANTAASANAFGGAGPSAGANNANVFGGGANANPFGGNANVFGGSDNNQPFS